LSTNRRGLLGLAWLHEGEIDVVLSTRHESVDDDNGLVSLFVYADKNPLPVDAVDIYPEPFGQSFRDERLLLFGVAATTARRRRRLFISRTTPRRG
jgi:hypothetical protein